MIHRFYVAVEMAVRDGVDRDRAEAALEGIMDHGMFYTLGLDQVKDGGHPYIFDYEILEKGPGDSSP